MTGTAFSYFFNIQNRDENSVAELLDFRFSDWA